MKHMSTPIAKWSSNVKRIQQVHFLFFCRHDIAHHRANESDAEQTLIYFKTVLQRVIGKSISLDKFLYSGRFSGETLPSPTASAMLGMA
jgi:hypothetical protein